ncbi:MAG TPA: uroporphyrinogen-III C-methyltransferase [Candidatus Binatia bacterium]|jgi:uroporphyrinogen III methyltransferase/synthase|nr:uroporphyrinogen-III C-methyltransferase [Candidatus Binatia bacterium]
MSTGRVYLVGAGPGDPGLLTLRAARCLAEADVVVHDYLVGERLLDGVRAGAEVIAIGREARLGQEAIEAILVDRARAGKVVVRLKNGDPFLFGRGGEEAEALACAGVPFEVVPGVPSAIAVPAFAGIPVTHRDRASLVTIATGHQAATGGDAEDVPPALPWAALARQGGTLVFLMGMRHLGAIMDALAAHGLAPSTPAAVVSRGTTGRQRTVVATVGTLAARAAALEPPAVIVVGDVVALRERIAWVERRPLLGRRIVVTRPRAQASALAERLETAGADVILFPTIVLVPPPDPAALDAAVARAADYDWIVFTSANGVAAFFERLAARGGDVRSLARVRLAAIGPETAAALDARLLRAAVQPADHRAEGLLEALPADAVRGRRILLPRASGARGILPETLRARGAVVDEVIAYRAVPPPDADAAALRAELDAGRVDALTFTSSSTVENFVALVGRDVLARAVRDGRPAVACIGPVTAGTARAHGLPVDVVPPVYTAAALTDALVERLRTILQ